jgi:hypothetical protein
MLSLVLFVGLYAVLGVIAFKLAVKSGTSNSRKHEGAAAD